MEQTLSLFIRSIFVDNMIFASFLGMCSYLAVSKNVKTSFGLGVAVIFVLMVTVPINYLLQVKVLSGGIGGYDLSYLSFILFIAVIAGITLSMVGSGLIFCVGVNIVWDRKIRVANMLPAVLVAVVWAYFQ